MRRSIGFVVLAGAIIAGGVSQITADKSMSAPEGLVTNVRGVAPQSASSGQADESLFTVREATVRLVKTQPVIEFELTNRAHVPAVGWGVFFEFDGSDGPQRLGFARDAGAASETERRVVPPNGTLRESYPVLSPGTRIENLKTSLSFVIFADDTWIGNEADVQRMFGQRKVEHDAWMVVGDALRLGLQVGGRPGLEKTLEALNRSDQPDFDNPNKSIMRKNIRLDAVRIKAAPDEFLRRWVRRADARVQETEGRHAIGVRRVAR